MSDEGEWKTIQIAPLSAELYVRVWSKLTPYGQPVDIEGFPSRRAVVTMLQVRGEESRVVLGVVDVHGDIRAVEPRQPDRHNFKGVHAADHPLASKGDPLGDAYEKWSQIP
ncbi:hypothetical protein MSTE_02002 [Mycobacteroides stephanolepidis]|uniref:Uncharacterized protein n=1 Tax=[Mycobacterium] stephanolepidis TaxID=1520670 RepID=A0A1Z4EWH9_9MYCO|nr:hypothetical protein [[Mycobacterium] stephanolepidis]BAX97318.1 hypothetical protein MSTE_02002 [[Mycobacterium] stephanolepidis]